MRPRGGGFTLLELAAGVALVAVLVVLLFSALGKATAHARAAACLGQLRALGAAFGQYLGDHGMTFPQMEAGRASRSEDVPVLDAVLAPYVGDRRVFACPADRRLATETGTSYFYNSTLAGQPLATLNFLGLTDEKTRIPVLVDKEGWHRGAGQPVNHLFADGHAGSQLRLFAE